jgi:hypothetical protein
VGDFRTLRRLRSLSQECEDDGQNKQNGDDKSLCGRHGCKNCDGKMEDGFWVCCSYAGPVVTMPAGFETDRFKQSCLLELLAAGEFKTDRGVRPGIFRHYCQPQLWIALRSAEREVQVQRRNSFRNGLKRNKMVGLSSIQSSRNINSNRSRSFCTSTSRTHS